MRGHIARVFNAIKIHNRCAPVGVVKKTHCHAERHVPDIVLETSGCRCTPKKTPIAHGIAHAMRCAPPSVPSCPRLGDAAGGMAPRVERYLHKAPRNRRQATERSLVRAPREGKARMDSHDCHRYLSRQSENTRRLAQHAACAMCADSRLGATNGHRIQGPERGGKAPPSTSLGERATNHGAPILCTARTARFVWSHPFQEPLHQICTICLCIRTAKYPTSLHLCPCGSSGDRSRNGRQEG